jgi:multicomponent Na+:H+ antiporter subunit D
MSASQLAPLAFAAPLTAAAAIAAFGSVLPRRANDLIAIFAGMLTAVVACALLTVVAASGTVVHWFGGWTPSHGVALGIAFVVDPIGGALATFAALLTMAALIFAWTYYDEGGPEFHTLMLVFAAALIGFFLTGDLFNLFVFFELMSVSAYALTGFRSEDESAVLGALSFAVVNSVGAFLVLIGIVMLYARTGALNLAQLGHALAGPADPLVIVAFALITFGFLVKASIVPAHFWLSEAHAVAPTPLCVLFSGIMVQAGIYAVARVYADVFAGPLAPHAHELRAVLLGFGLLTAVVGAAMCFAQRHLKRLLAFSTVSHSGIMLCAFALFSARGLGGLMSYVIGHGLVKGALFMCSGIVLNRWRTLDVQALRGRLRERRWLVTLLAAGGLALAGLPLFGTFVGKALIDRAATDAGLAWLPFVLLAAAAATSGAVLRALGTMAFGWGPPPEPDSAAESPKVEDAEITARGVPRVMLLTASALLAGCVAFAFVPARTTLPLAAALRFLDRPLKLAVTLGGVPSGPLPAVAAQPLGEALWFGLGSSALALALAAYALFGHRSRGAVGRAVSALVHPLRLAHSGVVTDYVAWLVAGAVAFGFALAALVR